MQRWHALRVKIIHPKRRQLAVWSQCRWTHCVLLPWLILPDWESFILAEASSSPRAHWCLEPLGQKTTLLTGRVMWKQQMSHPTACCSFPGNRSLWSVVSVPWKVSSVKSTTSQRLCSGRGCHLTSPFSSINSTASCDHDFWKSIHSWFLFPKGNA